MEDGRYVDGSIWFYAPNKGAPVFFAVAFAVSCAWHIYQCITYKSWRLTGFYVFTGAVFTAGFIVREIGAFDYQNLNLYIVSICMVYAAPPIMELANYNILGRCLYYVPQLSPIHPGRVITTFAAISGVVEALNGNGAAYASNQSLSLSKQNMGRALLKASLIIQIGVILCFTLLISVFHRRTLRAGIRNARLTNALVTLYISTGLLFVRTIFRVVEFFDIADLHFGPGFDPMSMSPIIRYEWFFMVFEGTLMLVNTYMMNIRHPRKWLPKSTKTYLAKDGVTEIQGPGYKEDRNFIVTILDPFDLWGLFRGRDKQSRFWEVEEERVQREQEKEAKTVGPRNAADPEAA